MKWYRTALVCWFIPLKGNSSFWLVGNTEGPVLTQRHKIKICQSLGEKHSHCYKSGRRLTNGWSIVGNQERGEIEQGERKTTRLEKKRSVFKWRNTMSVFLKTLLMSSQSLVQNSKNRWWCTKERKLANNIKKDTPEWTKGQTQIWLQQGAEREAK